MSSKELPPLPSGQREVMEVVWDRGEVSVFEARDILAQRRPISRTAVKTTLQRLEEKGWLKHRVVGRTYFYSPLVSRDVSLGQRIARLVDQSCGGDAERLMTALIDYRGLTDDEAERIQALLDEAKSRKPRRNERSS